MERDYAAEIAELADELCDPRQHVEMVPGGWTKSRNKAKPTRHVVVLPGLIQQLYDAALDPAAALMEGAGGKPKSRPPFAVEIFSTYDDIVKGAMRWVHAVRAEPRDTVQSNIRARVGLVHKLDIDTAEALFLELRTWRRWCATMTGWDRPPFRPRICCPECESKGSIWINGDKMLAYCKECQAHWEGDQIGDLAELVRAA